MVDPVTQKPAKTGETAAASALRTRLSDALAEIERLRNNAAAMHHLSEHSRLVGKAEGVALAISYLDEFGSRGGAE